MNLLVELVHSKKGFTVFEMIIVIGLMAIIAAIGYSFSFIYLQSQILSSASMNLTTQIVNAQSNAYIQKDDNYHGIALLEGQIVHFEGQNYASRDIQKDIVVEIADTIELSGDSEIVFTPTSMEPVSPATFTLTSGDNTINVVIDQYGKIEVSKGSS